jgi:hypothetical protein
LKKILNFKIPTRGTMLNTTETTTEPTHHTTLTDIELTRALGSDLFSEEKAAQFANILLYANDGSMPKTKLILLMYLAERETYTNIEYRGWSMGGITQDGPIATSKGMMLIRIYNLLNNKGTKKGDWEKLITQDNKGTVFQINKEIKDENLGELSELDFYLAKEISDTYKAKTINDLIEITKSFPEYIETEEGQIIELTLQQYFTGMGFNQFTTNELILTRIETAPWCKHNHPEK